MGEECIIMMRSFFFKFIYFKREKEKTKKEEEGEKEKERVSRGGAERKGERES